MDDDAERQEDLPASKSGRVRIIGAEPAAQSPGPPGDEVTEPGVSSVVTEPGVASAATGADASRPAPDADPTPEAAGVASPPPTAGTSPEMPHWTEAPTGEVPAVLARDPGPGADDPWSSVPGPTWREEHQDWVAHEEAFEPSMLAFDDPRRGSLDEEIDAERQPWTFDLPGSEAPEPGEDILEVGGVAVVELHEPIGDDTLMVPAVGPADPGPERIVVGDVDGTVAAASVAEDEIGPGAGSGAAADVPPVPRGHRAGGSSRPMRRRSRRVSETEGVALAAGVSAAEAAGPEADRPTEAPSARPVPPAPPPTPRPRTRPPSAPSAPSGGRNDRNMGLAVVTGLVLVVLALIVFHLGTVLTMILVTILVTIAAAEAYAAVRRGGYHPANLVGLVATVSLMVATYNKGQAALPLVTVLLVACALLWYVLGVERVDAVRGASATIFVFAWVGVFGSYAALLLDPTLFPQRHGIAFLLGALICGAAYDIGALAVGRGIGRHPMAPSVSPNKTWEGAVGGAVASIAAGVIIVHFIHPWTLRTALELGIVVAVVAPLGDLFESAFKRSLGLKDMSRILPGHGGLLDRVDGLLFILPATYYLVKAVHLG